MIIQKAYNFKQLDKFVSSSGTLKNIDLKSFLSENYSVVINLLPNDSEYAIEGEKKDLESLGIHYVYIPIDWSEPKHSDYEAFESAMTVNDGKKLHIHCAANYRASAFFAIYAYNHMGWSKSKLTAFINGIWKISEYPVWVEFVSQLTPPQK